MVTGSLASSYHGLPRVTQDIDLVVDGLPERILDAVRRLRPQGERLDRSHVERWVGELGVADEWDRVVSEADG